MNAMVKDPNTLLTVFPGTVSITGTVTPNLLGATLPSTLRAILRHKSVGGFLLRTITCDLTIQTSGAILLQLCPMPAFNVSAGESVELSLDPLDRALPASSLTVRVNYRRT